MKVEVTNFGSYRELSFDFSNLGLSLISGETGSGKSTLQDMVAWALYGLTAKNGSVDEVRNWDNLEEPTSAKLTLNGVTILRTRGKPHQNDLYWVEEGSESKQRGKDISETQKLLEKRIGISADIFFTGSYFNEFSPAGRFFTDSAKNRRALFEKIADLSFPQNLSIKLLDKRKVSKSLLKDLALKLAQKEGILTKSHKSLEDYKESYVAWDTERDQKVQELTARVKGFEVEKHSKIEVAQTKIDRFEQNRVSRLEKSAKQIDLLNRKIDLTAEDKLQTLLKNFSEVCITCGQPRKDPEVDLLKQVVANNELLSVKLDALLDAHALIEKELNPYIASLETVKSETNMYSHSLSEEQKKSNPFTMLIVQAELAIATSERELFDLRDRSEKLTKEINGLSTLNDLTSDLRGVLLENAIREVEHEANRIIEEFFDSIFRITLTLSGDDLEVIIHKDGRECSFTQLSKGQRQLLNLAYSIAVMKKTSSECGVTLPVLMFDEALDGLDVSLKTKAYRLFEELALIYPSIVLIDHSIELQSLFNKKFHVTLNNGNSEVEEVE